MTTRPTTHSRGERGVFLVWIALMMVTLLMVAGLAIEWNNLSRVGARMQKAADAAALAGAPFLPQTDADPVNLAPGDEAYDRAMELAADNGFPNGGDTLVRVTLGDSATVLHVDIQQRVPNIFARMLGNGGQTIVRSADATYEGPVAMGSPVNQFGNDPINGSGEGTPTYPGLWASVHGPDSPKLHGNAITGGLCYTGSSDLSAQPDNCAHPQQYDYDENGYFYAVNVSENDAGEPLKVELFDAGFVEVGELCDSAILGGYLAEAATLPQTPSFNPTVYPGSAPFNPAVVYARNSTPNNPSSNGVRYCSGDSYYSSSGVTPPRTSFILRAPDDTPSNPTDNPIIGGSCSLEFPGRTGNIKNMVTETTKVDTAPDPVAKYFRQWYPMCGASGVPSAQVGTYYVQVTTAFRKNGVTPVPSVNGRGSGSNHFSIRAGLGSVTSNEPDVTIYANGKMGIYTNRSGSFALFYLARIPPADASRTLVLDLYDIGDIANAGTGDLTILPPADANLGPSFTGCTWMPPPSSPGNRIFTPYPGGQEYGPFQPTATGCQIPGVNLSQYNGHWLRIKIPIPAGYNCDVASPTGCWTRIRYDFSGATILDTTTWRAFMEGNRPRLIQ